MAKYKLVNNTEYGVKGVYYGGLNKKYGGMFDITTERCAKVYDTIEEAKADQQMLKKSFGYECFEIETTKEIVK